MELYSYNNITVNTGAAHGLGHIYTKYITSQNSEYEKLKFPCISNISQIKILLIQTSTCTHINLYFTKITNQMHLVIHTVQTSHIRMSNL
jgi:hypothetical protein